MKLKLWMTLGLTLLLSLPACENESQRGQKTDDSVETTAEVKPSKEKEDDDVKVRVRTPVGDVNVDVER
jgi:hypothetical protein